MGTAFVLGNGLSRSSIDLKFLKTKGTIYGCNALYREFVPDVLVATDRPIAEKIQAAGYALTNKFYTRKPVPSKGAARIPQEYWGFSSGPAALAIAAEDQHSKIYLLGFDLGPTKDNKFNNVYANTEFYKTSQSVPTYTGNWVQQIVTVTKKFSQTQFVRVQGDTTAAILHFKSLNNFAHLSLEEFLKQLNNG
jgi:hypothetical protein